MTDRPSETYACQCKGYSNGYGSSFQAAPVDWFTERGLSLPKNCPNCREWTKAQMDELVRCPSCKCSMRFSARHKISHYKRVGPWATPDQCRSCERGDRPPRSTAVQPPNKEKLRRASGFAHLPVLRWAEIYSLDINPANYTHPTPSGTETRQAHIEAHTNWSPHSMTRVNNGTKDPTALASHSQDFGNLLRSANIVAQAQDPDRTREYVDAKHGRIIRVTLTDSARIEITVIEPLAGTNGHQGHELVTTYDGYTIAQVQSKLNSGAWH